MTRPAGAFDETDLYFHYDQVGSVMMASNSAGSLQTTHHQDAWGNVMNDWQTGLWASASGQAGWHHNTKATGGDLGLVYMYQRWYGANMSQFPSTSTFPIELEVPYGFAFLDPVTNLDPKGEFPAALVGCGIGAGMSIGKNWITRKLKRKKYGSKCEAIATNACLGAMGCGAGALTGFAGAGAVSAIRTALEQSLLRRFGAAAGALAGSAIGGLFSSKCVSPCEKLGENACAGIENYINNSRSRREQESNIL